MATEIFGDSLDSLSQMIAAIAGLGTAAYGLVDASKFLRGGVSNVGFKHIRTKPYTPRTNGKAERFIQTSLREWAYARAYPNSRQRKAELPIWLHQYNWHRPHAGIHDTTPISRLGLPQHNLLRLHS